MTATTKKTVKKAAKKVTKTPVKKATKAPAKKAATKAAKKKDDKILLPIRMSLEGDRLLRTSEKAYQIGNLTKRVLAALENVDLETVKVEDRDRSPFSGKTPYEVTTIKLPKEVKQRVNEIADARGISMSALIDGAVRKFFKEKKAT